MPNIDLLKESIKDSGMTMTAVAKKMGISRTLLYYRMDKKKDFTASEIVSLTKMLGLSKQERDKIFLS